MNKYEQLIEAIISEDDSAAKDIFHQIVVEKSRDIYESLMEEETSEEVEAEELADEVEADEVAEAMEITAEEAKALMDYVDSGLVESVDTDLLERVAQYYGVEVSEGLLSKLEESSDELLDIAYGAPVAEEGDEEEADMDMPADEEEMDFDADGELDAHEEEHGDIEDRVFDLESAIDELQAEFDELMSGDKDEDESEEESEEESAEDEIEDADEAGDEEIAEEADEEIEEEEEVSEERDELEVMREYVEKVAGVSNQEGADNKQSTVAGKNDMGGSADNIASGSAEEKGSKAKAPKEIASGNRNVPGGKADSLEAAPKAKSGE